MKVKEFIANVVSSDTSISSTSLIENKYGIETNERSKKIINSVTSNTQHFDDGKLLSINEVFRAGGKYNLDFNKYMLIPFFDIGDGIVITYNKLSDTWCKFDTINLAEYNHSKDILGIFK